MHCTSEQNPYPLKIPAASKTQVVGKSSLVYVLCANPSSQRQNI